MKDRGKQMRITVYINPEDNGLIEMYAEQAGRSVSDYLRRAGLSEGPRHMAKPKLLALIDARIEAVVKKLFPARGDANGDDMNGPGQEENTC